MEVYAAAGGAVESVISTPPVGEAIAPCKKWLELRYLHCDGTPVKEAQYHVRSPGFSSDGTLDANGFVHIADVPDISGFTYWFDHDPEQYVPQGPQVSTSSGPARQPATSALDEVADWIWGTIQGDFNKNQSKSQLAVNVIIGLIPIADQVLDVRDIISGLKDIIEFYCEDEQQQKAHEETLGLSYEVWLWIAVFIIAIGCIPILGSAVKGVFKGIIRFLQDFGKTAGNLSLAQLRKIWEDLLKILNHLGITQGNAHKWLKELSGKLGGLMDEAAAKIKAGLDSIRVMVEKAEEYARQLGGKDFPVIGEVLSSEKAQQIIAKAQKYKASIATAYKRLDDMKQRINAWLAEQLEKILGGKHKFEAEGSVKAHAYESGPNVRIQEEAPPPEIRSPEGKLKGQRVALKGMKNRRIKYEKRPDADRERLRKAFNQYGSQTVPERPCQRSR